MPAATKMQRRKAQPSSRLSGKNTPLIQPNASANIGSFARVSKAISVPAKDLDAKPTTAAVTTVEVKSSAATTPSSRKRKTAATSDDESTPTQERASKRISSVSKPVAPAPTSRRAVRSTRTVSTSASSTPTQQISSPPKPVAAGPQRKRGRSPSPASDFESDKSTIDTGALFKRLRLEASPGPATPPLTPDASGISDTESTPDILPDEALGLIDLQSALLRTLTLHYAHNGPNTPADLQRLLPDVARAWRRRKVSKAEVQTCIGVLAASKGRQPFLLIDYGRNKICIELDQAYTTAMYDEREFNARFYDNLSALWRKFCSGDENASGKLFLESLPRASITVSESFTKAAPIFAKGQQRLDDLKQGITAKKLEKEVQQQAADSPMANSDGTKMSLLDRIRQKALQKAQAPAGLTPAQLERRAALQRAAEVAALLAMLSRATANGSGGRMPFTMTAMLEKLKDTFRMGISREEGAACVRLLGKEIAPEWIRVVVVAGRENVVIDTNRTLGKADIERRVQQLL